MRFALALAAALLALAAGPAGAASIYRTGDWTRIEEPVFAADAATADILFLGEQHGSRAGHAFELRVLEMLAARNRPVALALEMFERDVQPALDDYLAGRTDETRFLAASRPWSNYRADYRPLVELAKRQGWAVVAANAPRPLAARIARQGLSSTTAWPAPERGQLAEDLVCPDGPYRTRFDAAMAGPAGDAGAHGGLDPAAGRRLFESQCAKDETMAEAAVRVIAPGRTVVFVSGQFHTDERGGLVLGVARRRPDARLLTVSIRPVQDLEGERPPATLADYVVLTP